ncbi:MAG TPA: MarR family winged helix-turn-helix transcriptional regulator [Chloroflexota bacterium]|nr:MarR family winged helix-turn-helix transcriptional regulator [Chloroflexota bacterium]
MIDNTLAIVEANEMAHSPASNPEVFALLVADIYDAAGVLRRYGERTALSAGQTQARWQVLSVVSEGEWTVPRAADRLGTSRQAVQRIANELVGDGLALFIENSRRRRSPFVVLTPAGRGVLATITEQAQDSNRQLFAKLGDLDLDAVRSTLRQLTSLVRSTLKRDDPQRGSSGSGASGLMMESTQ